MDSQGSHNNNEEVDLIQLFNYFKNGIKSVFKGIGKLFHYFLFFIFLLRKYWVLTLSLIISGGVYGKFIKPLIENSDIKSYEMVVSTNPVANIELYAFASELSNQKYAHNDSDEGIKLANNLGIISMKIEKIERYEDVVNNYFEQIETNIHRGMETDTLFFQDFKIKNQKSKLKDIDYRLQKIQLKIKNNKNTSEEIQNQLIDYLNNLSGVKNHQQNRLAEFESYEVFTRNKLEVLDSLLYSRSLAYKNSTSFGTEPSILSASSRSNVEADVLRYSDIFGKKHYGIVKMVNYYKQSFSIVSNLRTVKEDKFIGNPMLKYSFLGLVLACLIILGLRFNKYLDKFENK